MCLTPFKIRSVNPVAPKLQFVPCGHCEDCRNSNKNAWSMRLSLELETARSNGWLIGFCTLTYNDENLPRFSDSAFDSSWLEEYKDVTYVSPSCFDKQQVRDFVVNIRRDLDSDFNVHGLKYMICSEYGSDTQRPHYHCIFAWQGETIFYDDNDAKYVVGCSAENFFKLIKKYWKYGFVFPRDIKGGVDSHGHLHKPFIVDGTARFAAAYAAKYCCKDLSFVKSLNAFKFDKKSKAFKNGDCFHIQNKSLGLSYLTGRSAEQLRDLVFRGVSFAGDKRLHQLPLYLRNKIFFSPLYIVERKVYDGIRLLDDQPLLDKSDDFLETLGFRVEYKRLVRRKCTSFFHENCREIFERKVKFWSETFKNLTSSDYLSVKFNFSVFDDDFFTPRNLSHHLDCIRLGISFDDMARFMVARFGVPYKCQYDVEDVDMWSFRYTMSCVPDAFKKCPLISKEEYRFMTDLISFNLSILGLAFSDKSEFEKRVEKVRDMFKHKE